MSEEFRWHYKCDCIDLILDKIIEVNKLELDEINFEHVSLSGLTASVVVYRAVGKKAVKRLTMVHRYCPFCGKKLIDEEGVTK